MTKEEKIKEAWCNQNLDEIDENGWINIGYLVNGLDDVELWLANNYFKRNINNWEIDYSELDNGEFINTRIRPKSLKGIENNNGWIKIEGQHDLPDIDTDYWVVYKGEVTKRAFNHRWPRSVGFWTDNITHYQPIEKPKPPLY